MHVNISQEPLSAEIYRKKARDQSEHPDQAPAFTATVRPLSVDTLSGEKQKRGSRDSSWNSPTTVCMEIQATKKVALSNKKDCYNITNDDGDKWSLIMVPTQM